MKGRQRRPPTGATYFQALWSPVLVFLAGFGLGGFTGAALGQAVQGSDWSEVTGPRYLSPIDLKLSPDGQQLYVVCEDSDLLLVVDTHNWQVTGRVKVGHKPKGIALSPNGKTLYVSNEWENTISEIDAHSFRLAGPSGRLGPCWDNNRPNGRSPVCGKYLGERRFPLRPLDGEGD